MRYIHGRLRRALRVALAVSATLAIAPFPRAQAPAAKDTLVFTNGDQLQGTFEKAEGDTITFKSDMAGEITVKLATIKELRSTSDFAVLLKGAKPTHVHAVLGKVEVEEGKLSVTRPQQPVATIPSEQLGYIVASSDYEKAIVNTHAPFAHWNGSLTGGATLVRATQNGTTLTAAASLIRLAPGVPYLPPHSRTTVNVVESYGKLSSPATTTSPASTVKTSIFHADAEYDRYFSQRLYALADLAFDHNFSQGLQLQQLYGGGLGYTVIQEPVQTFDVKGEIHYERQHFIQPPPPCPSPTTISSAPPLAKAICATCRTRSSSPRPASISPPSTTATPTPPTSHSASPFPPTNASASRSPPPTTTSTIRHPASRRTASSSSPASPTP